MADLNIKRITIYIYLVIGLTESVKLDETAQKKLLSGTTQVLLEFVPGGKNTILGQIQSAYNDRQKKVFEDLDQASNGMSDIVKVEGECYDKCTNSKPYVLYCFAKCLSEEASMEDYSKALAAAYDTFMCKPVAFKFLERFFNNASFIPWPSLDAFSKTFNEEDMAKELMIDVWFGNLALLERSPMIFYAKSQAQIRTLFVNDDNINDVNSLSAKDFSDRCVTDLANDVAPIMAELISKSSEKPYLLDIILRGLFAIRSAFFYTVGDHVNAAGAVVEALNIFAGKKCNFVKDEEGSTEDCDNFGHYPIPQFPIPSELWDDLDIDCNPDPGKWQVFKAISQLGKLPAAPAAEPPPAE